MQAMIQELQWLNLWHHYLIEFDWSNIFLTVHIKEPQLQSQQHQWLLLSKEKELLFLSLPDYSLNTQLQIIWLKIFMMNYFSCWIKYPAVQVSDTTKADSSNAAKYIKNLSLETWNLQPTTQSLSYQKHRVTEKQFAILPEHAEQNIVCKKNHISFTILLHAKKQTIF